MRNIDYIHEREIFAPLWQRARDCSSRIATAPAGSLLHWDSSNLATQVFLDLTRSIAALDGNGEFAVVVLDPDPFDYFHVHFGKYPGFIVSPQHSDEDFFDILMRDPGDSLADAIGVYSEKYAVLPISGNWFMYADRGWKTGTGVLGGPPDVMQFARERFRFYENPH
ncbi:hypothetical protein P3T18_006704 [Paraburkholderia sp. GAS199]|uniref:hypothetical protein n=1 Tax=Paraburkholderia sp. GAS199 TaxID=3035126 RepID=UPI003D1ADEA3